VKRQARRYIAASGGGARWHLMAVRHAQVSGVTYPRRAAGPISGGSRRGGVAKDPALYNRRLYIGVEAERVSSIAAAAAEIMLCEKAAAGRRALGCYGYINPPMAKRVGYPLLLRRRTGCCWRRWLLLLRVMARGVWRHPLAYSYGETAALTR